VSDTDTLARAARELPPIGCESDAFA
jgi:hypothetical protein